MGDNTTLKHFNLPDAIINAIIEPKEEFAYDIISGRIHFININIWKLNEVKWRLSLNTWCEVKMF